METRRADGPQQVAITLAWGAYPSRPFPGSAYFPTPRPLPCRPGCSGAVAGRGPSPKPDKARRHRPKTPASRSGSHVIDLRRAGAPDIPEAPDGLLERTQAWWEAYWTTDVARVVQASSDVPALSRLATLYDERERVFALLRAKKGSGPLVKGSQDQWVANPLYRVLAALDAEIRQLEDRFGLNPRARLSVGLALTQARRELEDLIDVNYRNEAEASVIELASGEPESPAESS